MACLHRLNVRDQGLRQEDAKNLQQGDGDEDAGHDVNIARKPALQRLDAAFCEDGLVPLALQLKGNSTAT